jgi:hypothetical protein
VIPDETLTFAVVDSPGAADAEPVIPPPEPAKPATTNPLVRTTVASLEVILMMSGFL